jgi:hypothetical protein
MMTYGGLAPSAINHPSHCLAVPFSIHCVALAVKLLIGPLRSADQDRRSRGLFSVHGIACSTRAK